MRKHILIWLNFAVIFLLIEGRKGDNTAGPCKPGKNIDSAENMYIDEDSITGGRIDCVNGTAGIYPCKNVALESYVPIKALNHGEPSIANDLWGWTSNDGREFALIGLFDGVGFVEITDSINPKILGKIPSHTTSTFWRDIKTYQDHAYIVSDVKGHGMQVFDLTNLLNASSFETYTIFSPTVHYSDFGRAHNIFINEETGFAYVVGSNKCDSGLYMINITSPSNPTFAGCYADSGYVHDVQCVLYNGPDSEHGGKEICFASNELEVDIIDVSDKQNSVLLSTFQYVDEEYTHQGWLTEDKNYFLIDDELDEYNGEENTKTFICDVTDLDNPVWLGTYTAQSRSIDHNQYVRGNFVYQANYQSGLRILGLDFISMGILFEVGYFDTYPEDNTNEFSGAWSNYAYFDSGVVIVSDIERGLFVVRPRLQSRASEFEPSLEENFPLCPDGNKAYLNVSIEVNESNDQISLHQNLRYITANQTKWIALNDANWIANDNTYVWGECLDRDWCLNFHIFFEELKRNCCNDATVVFSIDFEGERSIEELNHSIAYESYIGNCEGFAVLRTEESSSHNENITHNSSYYSQNTAGIILNTSASNETGYNESISNHNIEGSRVDGGSAQPVESENFRANSNDYNSSSIFIPQQEVFISNLDAVVGKWQRGSWNADIVATVSDDMSSHVSGVSLLGADQSGEQEFSCTTGLSGMCTLQLNNIFDEKIIFQIVRLWKKDYTYNEKKNRDLDGDSDGTFISITAPLQSNLR